MLPKSTKRLRRITAILLLTSGIIWASSSLYLCTQFTESPKAHDNRDKLLEVIFGPEFSSEAPILSTNVAITAYSASVEECDSEPWYTASGSLSRIGVLAVSRDLLSEVGLTYGQVVILENIGVFRIQDTMNPRFSHRVDILMGNPTAAKLWGRKKVNLFGLEE